MDNKLSDKLKKKIDFEKTILDILQLDKSFRERGLHTITFHMAIKPPTLERGRRPHHMEWF